MNRQCVVSKDLKGVFIEFEDGTKKRFVNDESFEYGFSTHGRALSVSRKDKKDGTVVDPWATYPEFCWACVEDI